MGEKDNHDAAAEARREVAAHPERPSSHEEAITRYLGCAAYRVAHHRDTPDRTQDRKEDEEP